MKRFNRITVTAVGLILMVCGMHFATAGAEDYWQITKRREQDRASGVPPKVLELQSREKVIPPSLEEACDIALKAAEQTVQSLIDTGYHNGRRLVVPDQFRTIQGAIDAAKSGDVVVVKPGTYYELLVMKDGVKLVSDASGEGNKLEAVEGARLQLPLRTLQTIIDGSKAGPSDHGRGMIDFDPGVGRNTIVDGFTIQNLPMQNHHIPGHAHALNLRGASPVIMHCYVRNNGSTGIGSHVVYGDQDDPMPRRDFRWANVQYQAEGVIYRNIVCGNVGLGIGCNHFSAPHILGNEVFSNDDSALGEEPSPGIGARHGAGPMIVGNIIHHNPGGGILSKVGEPQGVHPIDRPTHPTIMKNVVYENGKLKPGISSDEAGSVEMPVKFISNFIYDAGVVGIGIMNQSVCIVEGNVVSGSGSPGIVVSNATALKLNDNKVRGADGPGFLILNGGKVLEMTGNAADSNRGPRFVGRGGTIVAPGQ